MHIVWCESAVDYNRGTIGGQFNDAHIHICFVLLFFFGYKYLFGGFDEDHIS